MLLPLQPDEKQELDLLRTETGIPLGVLVYLRKKGFTPVETQVARRQGLLPARVEVAAETPSLVAK